jgi:hypothetical protein
MIKRIENKSNSKPTATVVKGKVESLNEKGLKVNSDWYNYSKFLSQKPEIRENDEVEFMTSGDFITKFLNVQHQTTESENDDADGLLLNSLRSAVKIASIIESEVSIKFSTQDIIKLALTLFIQKSSL